MSRIALIAALLWAAPNVHAQTWTGLGVNGNWSTAGNWDSVLSAPSSGSVLHFAGAVGLSSNVDTPWTVNGITFDAADSSSVSTGAFTLGGSALTLNTSGGIVVNGYNLTTSGATISVGTATVNNAITLGAAQTWQTGLVNSSLTGNLTVNGTVNNGGFLLTTNAQRGTVLTLGGIVSGAGGLTTSGLGTTTVSGANTYTGVTTVANGTLSINTLNNIGSANSATGTNTTIKLGNLTTTGTLQYTGGVTTSNRTISLDGTTGGGTIDSSGSGALTLTGPISGSTAGAKTLTLSGNSTASNTVSGSIANGSATLSLAKSGSGTWVLNGANTYTGSTTLNSGDSGTLTVNSGAAISTGALIVNGGTINLGNATQTVAGLSGSGGTVSLGTGTTLTSASAGTDSFYGVLSGSGNLTKTGAGTLALGGSGTNGTAYTGTTTLSAGKLAINSATALGTGTLKIDGGTLDTTSAAAVKLSTGNAITFNGSFTSAGTGNVNVPGSGNLNLGTGAVTLLSAAPTITVTANTLTIGGVISNGGGGSSFTKAGAGALTLSGANNFTGGVTLSAGTLNINNATALGTNTFTVSGASTIDNTSGAPITITNAQAWNGDLTFTGTNNLTMTTGAITLGAARNLNVTGGNLAIGSNIGGAFTLTKVGAGALTLSGTNGYSGLTTGNGTVTGGTVNINSAGALGTTFTVANGTTIDNTATNATTITATPTTTNLNANLTYAGANNSNLTLNGAVVLGANQQLTVTQGNLTLAGGISGNTFSINKTGAGSLTLGGAITTTTGNVTLTQGSLALNGANTFTGGVLLNGGTLTLGSTTALGGATSTFTIAGGTTLDSSVSNLVLSNNNPISLNGSTTFAGTQNLNVGAGAITLGATPTITVTANNLTLGGSIGGAFGLTKAGAGTLTLSGAASTYTGTTTLNAGTLALNTARALGNSGTAGTFVINGGTLDNTSGGAVTLSSNNAQTWNSGFTFAGSNALNLGTGAVTLGATPTINTTASTLTVGGVIGGAFGLTKAGSAGTLALTGLSTYSGATTINAGTLTLDFTTNATNLLNNSANSSALTLNGGTLNLLGKAGATDSQRFNGTNVSSGGSTIQLTQNGATTVTATLNAFNRTAGATLNFINVPLTAGIIATTTTTNTNGILGPWASVGSTTTLQYASVNGSSQIISYAGASGGGINLGSVTSATTNYSYSAAATLSANRTGNTLRYTGAATTTEISAATANRNLTLNGLMNAGTGTLTINDTAGGASGGLIIGANNELVIINNAQGTIINSVIRDGGAAGSVNFTSVGGAGTLTLTGANAFTGGLTLNSGIIRATTSTSALGAGTLTLQGGTLQLADTAGAGMNFGHNTTVGANTTIQSDRTASAAGTTQTLGMLSIGASTLNIAPGANATGSTAGITFGATTLTASGAVFTPALNSTLTLGAISGSGNSFTVNGAGNAAITGIIGTGAGGLTYAGTGTLTLSAVNTYTGGTTLSSGTLTVNNGAALAGATGALTINGGSLNLNNTAGQTVGSLNGTGGTINLASGVGLTVATSSSDTFAGTIAGAFTTANLTKSGTGTLALTGSNSYQGVTTINGGTLSVSTLALGGSNSGIGAATNAASNLVIDGGTLKYTGPTMLTATDRGFTIGSGNATLDASGRGMLNFGSGTVAFSAGATDRTLTLDGIGVGQFGPVLGNNGANTASLVKNGVGTWTLTGLNTYTGSTTLNAGTLTVNSGSSIGLTSGTGNLVVGTSGSAATLYLNNAAQSVASIAGNTNGTINLGAGHTLTDTGNTTQTFSGTLAGAGNFTLNGGTNTNLTLSGANTNLQGAITVSAGKLIAGAINALGNGAVTVSGTGAALGLSGTSWQNLSSLTLSGTGVSGSGALFNNDANTNVLNTNLTLGGATTITSAVAGGTLQIGAGIGVNTLKDYFGASGHAQPDEIGTVTLGSGNNLTFSGAGNITVLNRIQDFAGQSAVNTPTYGSAGSVTINMTGGTVTYGAVANTYTGTTNVNSGTLFINTYNNAGVAPHDAVTDSFHGVNGPLMIGNGGTATVKLGGDDAIASTAPITLYSTGTFDLNNHGQTIDTLTFNHGGAVNFTGGGTLYLNKDVTFTASAGETAAINGTGGVISLRLLPNIPIDDAVTDAIRTFTVSGTSTSNLLINGNIQNGSLVKAGAGTLTLGTASGSDYTGMTIVNAGILNVQKSTSGTKSSLGSGNGTDAQGTTVASGATLQIQGGTSITTERLNLNGTGYTAGAGALQSVSGANVWGTAGAITYLNLSGDARIQTNAGTLSIPTNITSFDNGRALTVGVDLGATTTISGGINTGSGSGTTLTKDGYGTLVLNPTSSGYQGATNITQGILSLQSAGGLGATTTGADGTFVTSGAQLQLAGGISVPGEALTLNGTGYNNGTYNDATGALRNAANNNSFAGTLALGGDSRISAATGTTLTLSGGIDTAVPLTPSHKDLTILGNVTETGQVLNGSVTTATYTDAHGIGITKVTGSGGSTAVVTVNGANVTRATGGTITIGGTAVDQTGTYNGTTWANASGNLTLGGGATSAVDGITLTLGNLTVGNGSGNTIVQSGPINSTNANNVLTITGTGDKVNSYYGAGVTEVFTGQLAGLGTFQKDGAGILVFDTSFTATSLTLIVSGGEIDLRRNASNLGTQTNITFGTIRIIGNTILDFDSSYATTLSSSILIIDAGVTVTVNNWASETDFWMLTGAAGSFYQPNLPTDINVAKMALDATGNSPQGRITFTGSGYTAANTAWVAWGNPGPYTNNEIRPIPEPATYGVFFFSGCLALLGWRRYSRRAATNRK